MPTNDRNRKVAQDLSDAEAERLLYEMMLQSGWLIPQTPADVERAEKEMQMPAELPQSLRDPLAVLDGRTPVRLAPPPSVAADLTAAENMACAARHGGEIPPEVRAKMEQDRKQAE